MRLFTGFGGAVAGAAMGAALTLAPATAMAACSLKAVEIPVTVEGLRPYVEAKVNGAPVKFILDSGAFYNSIDGKIAAERKLKPYQVAKLGTRFTTAARAATSGVGGDVRLAGVVTAEDVELAGRTFHDMGFLAVNVGDGDGLLGQNFLHQLDNEYDLKDGVLRMVQPAGCEGQALAYWVKPPMTFSAAPLVNTGRADPATVAMITVNGVELRAEFDTGSPTSYITASAAARAGVATTDPGVTPAGTIRGLDRDDIKTWVGRFASVKIGDEEIKNGLLTIGASYATAGFDLLIGADFFLAHRVYVANSQHMIYFTYSGGPVFRTPPPLAETTTGETAAGEAPHVAK